MENTSLLKRQREEAVPRAPFHVTPLFVARAKGAVLYDVAGKEYIDFTGGIGAANAGHAPDEVVQAIKDQAEKYLHTCFNVMMYEPYIKLAQRLNTITPGDFSKQSMFFNSGAEAVENAVKIARYATGRPAIIAFEHAFHGRTLLTMSLTSKVKPYKYGFGPFAPEIYRAQYPYSYRMPPGYPQTDTMEAYTAYFEGFFKNYVAADKVAAILIEPVLGEGGFLVPPPQFLPAIKRICERNGIVFIADEIQTGFCRTGKMFAVEHFGIEPDIIVTGKSLASGLPLSAVTAKKELIDSVPVGGLGGTYAGNPIACQAALATLDIYEKRNLARRAVEIGSKVKTFYAALQESSPYIGDIRGLGAMIGVEIVKDRRTKEPNPDFTARVVKRCYEHGLLIMSAGTYGNVLRTLMPLVISDEQLTRAFAILQNVILEEA